MVTALLLPFCKSLLPVLICCDYCSDKRTGWSEKSRNSVVFFLNKKWKKTRKGLFSLLFKESRSVFVRNSSFISVDKDIFISIFLLTFQLAGVFFPLDPFDFLFFFFTFVSPISVNLLVEIFFFNIFHLKHVASNFVIRSIIFNTQPWLILGQHSCSTLSLHHSHPHTSCTNTVFSHMIGFSRKVQKWA